MKGIQLQIVPYMFKFNQKRTTLGNKLKFKQGLFNINFPNICIIKLNYLKSRKMKSMTSILFWSP